ncbi:hypothetical protein [Nocardia sp. NPDC051570]|uniref:hypothetical protein n=1 Tax=Nocardia sp. NPDC051570 TaxID=3364324 RepID=UPI003798AB88
MSPSTSRGVIIAAWLAPALIIGQFALVAAVPVAIVSIGSLRNRRLRWWATALATAYAIPLCLWILRPDRAPSLSKDIHPALAALVVATSVTVAVVAHRTRGRATA